MKANQQNDHKAFLRQFDLARQQVAYLAKLYPSCFDKHGRPVVATLRFPSLR